jgi:hypothetical protein
MREIRTSGSMRGRECKLPPYSTGTSLLLLCGLASFAGDSLPRFPSPGEPYDARNGRHAVECGTLRLTLVSLDP